MVGMFIVIVMMPLVLVVRIVMTVVLTPTAFPRPDTFPPVVLPLANSVASLSAELLPNPPARQGKSGGFVCQGFHTWLFPLSANQKRNIASGGSRLNRWYASTKVRRHECSYGI